MIELEMIKAFAKLEGVEITEQKCWIKKNDGSNTYESGITTGMYNPLTNHALTFKAVVDYGVNINQDKGVVAITNKNVSEYDINSEFISFVKDDKLSYAIIECILKSKGLYVA